MINLEELRLGNYVIDDGSPVKITRPFMVYLLERKVSDIEPVPLTPDLLEKCGFVKDDCEGENAWYRLKFGKFTFETDESVEFKKVYVIAFGKEITYETTLHQLQNLVFVLTGSELPITL